MAELSGIYGADSFANMTPEQFLEMAQGQGLGNAPISTEFPGLGGDYSDMFGIDSFLEDRAQGSFKGVDADVLERQAESGNERAAAEIFNRAGEFGGIESISDIDQPLELPEIDMSGLDVEYQMGQAAKEDARGKAAEAFRSQEQSLMESQGGFNSSKISESTAVTQEQADEGFLSAMDDFLAAAVGTGPGKPKERTIEEYKKVFSEATGIDTSGKVDKRDALMAFGLALMQNKAGKGFNVGKMLKSVGEAGDKALPALAKAKAEAKQAGLAAGQYALGARNSDRAKDEVNAEKAKQRSDYYIVPKSKGVSGFLANMDQGQLESLNSFELDALMTNNSFREKFDVLPGGTWSGIVSEAMKTPEAGVYWDTKAPRKIELFGEGAGDMFTIEAWRALPQSGKDNKLVGSGQDAYDGLARAARDMGKARQKFGDAFGLIEGTNAFRFSLDKVDSLAAAFGVNFKEGTNNTEKLKLFLTKLQAKNAKEILGEAGKTISDADRALVRDIVGNVDLFSNPELLEQKVTELFQEIVVKKEQDILDALTTLDRYSGRRIASRLDNGNLDEAGYAELQGYLASPAFEEN